MKRSSLVFHVPHASTIFPFQNGFIRPDLIAGEVEKLTDWYTDRIFQADGVTVIQAGFSRVFCDVERFVPDELEPMAVKGMGFYYTRTDDGQPLRESGNWKDRVLREFYQPHHVRLTEVVREKLRTTGSCCIIDGHSFSEIPFLREQDQNPDRPDICLGTQGLHTPPWLKEAAETVYRSAGLSVRFDAPYSGSMVPLEYLDKDPRVFSIMVEVNRRLYLRGTEPIAGCLEKLTSLAEQLVGGLERSSSFQ